MPMYTLLGLLIIRTVASDPEVLTLSLLSQFGIVQSDVHESSKKNELVGAEFFVSDSSSKTGGSDTREC